MSPPKKRGSEIIFNALEKAKRTVTSPLMTHIPSRPVTPTIEVLTPPPHSPSPTPVKSLPELPPIDYDDQAGAAAPTPLIPALVKGIDITVEISVPSADSALNIPEFEDVGSDVLELEAPEFQPADLVELEVSKWGAQAEDSTNESCGNAYDDMPSAKQKVKGQPTKKKKGTAKSKTQAPYNPYAETQLPTEETPKTDLFLKKTAKSVQAAIKAKDGYISVSDVELDIKEMLEMGKRASRAISCKNITTMVEQGGGEVASMDSRTSNHYPLQEDTGSFTDDSEEWAHDDDDDEPLSSLIEEDPTERDHIQTMSMPEMGSREPSIHNQQILSDASIDGIDMQVRHEALQKLDTFFHKPVVEDPIMRCKEEADMVVLPPPDLYADIIISDT
nr:uncharacterized protein LOC115121029 isoform X4 [Oncorhynchus nerka]XP_029505908.1 uncharacterized protein LOC115121029 isoform X5 [Oncorhynchus nerka]